ncbi:unnamed protein product [Leptidea sinapis]|uniref:Uncharacterized protein n=1 Tax=Leptidea sinapis TaxID=189913 RepID=A0A5E4R4B4_9NEOP|nr:unnamed protein product [Leptidea sinapis]
MVIKESFCQDEYVSIGCEINKNPKAADELLQLCADAALDGASGNRIGRYLCEESIKAAKRHKNGPVAPIAVEDMGPKYSMLKARKPLTTFPKICSAIWTSPYSQKIGKTLNFKVHMTVPLSEFMHDGKSYSERIGAPVFCQIAAIPL